MKIIKKETLVNNIWGENADEVLEFLDQVAPEKATFRDEKSLLNHLGRWLVREINRSSLDEPWPGFWDNRKQAVGNEWQHSNRPKNILYVIRLLNGKISLPVLKEEW